MRFEESFAPFAQAYQNRFSASLEDDKKRVCLIGADIPLELVEACGWSAIRLPGHPDHPTPDGSHYIGGGADADVRSQFQMLLDGAYGPMEHLVIAHDFEGLARLYYALRALRLRHTDRTEAFPAPHFFDLLHMPWRSTGLYNRVRTRQLRDFLGGCSDAALRTAIAKHNANRRKLLTLRDHRHAGQLSGVEALQIIGARYAMSSASYGSLLDALLPSLATRPPRQGKRIFLTGSAHDHIGHYSAIEAAGALIIGEDHDWGDRGYEAIVAEDTPDPLDALVDSYHFGTAASAKFSIRDRAAYTAKRVKDAGAEAVIAFIRAEDPAPRWDVPDQQAATAPLPFLLIDNQPYAASDPELVMGTVQQFIRAREAVA